MKIIEKINSHFAEFDTIVTFIGIFLSSLLIFYAIWKLSAPVIIIDIFFLHSLFYGVLVFFFCVLWLILRKYDPLNIEMPESDSRFKIWAICFFTLYILSIFILILRPNIYERPLLYFIFTILMGGAIACEIVSAKRKYCGVILIQILLLGISLSGSLQLIVPSIIGGDPWYHSGLTNKIIESHFIPDNYGYSTIPLFHLISTITTIVTTLSYKFATFLSVSLGQIIINVTFVFLIADTLFKNHRIGLLSALLVIIGGEHILRTIAPIPFSFGSIFLIIVLFLLITKTNDQNRFKDYIIVFLLMIPIILTHSLMALIMAFCLFVIWAGFYFCSAFNSKQIKKITLTIPVGFTIILLVWWYYVSTIQATAITRAFGGILGLDIDFPSVLPNIASGISNSIGETIFSNLGLYLFFTISAIGLLYMISRKGNCLTFTAAGVIFVPVFFYTCVIFLGSYFLAGQSNLLSRWVYVSQIVISIPLAFSLYSLATYKIKNVNYLSIFLSGIIIFLSILLIVSPNGGSPDINIFSPSDHYWPYYTDSEMIASDYFASKTVGAITTDREYGVEPGSSVFLNHFNIDVYRLQMIDFPLNSGKFEHDRSIKIIRTRLVSEFQRQKILSSSIKPNIDIYLSNNGFDKIYNSQLVLGYL